MQQTTIALHRRERVVEHACVQTCRLFAVEEVHAGAQHDHVRMVCTKREVGPGAGRVECTALGLPPIVRLRVEQVVVAEELEACRAFARERYDVARVAPRGPSELICRATVVSPAGDGAVEHHREALG